MYMKLIDPERTRVELARQRGWYTQKEIAAGCDIAETAARKALRGEAVWVQTITAIARCIGKTPIDIAEFVS
jgi:hypothetical protein